MKSDTPGQALKTPVRNSTRKNIVTRTIKRFFTENLSPPQIPPSLSQEGVSKRKLNVCVCVCAVAHGIVSLTRRVNVRLASVEAIREKGKKERSWTHTQTNIFFISDMLGGIS